MIDYIYYLLLFYILLIFFWILFVNNMNWSSGAFLVINHYVIIFYLTSEITLCRGHFNKKIFNCLSQGKVVRYIFVSDSFFYRTVTYYSSHFFIKGCYMHHLDVLLKDDLFSLGTLISSAILKTIWNMDLVNFYFQYFKWFGYQLK